MEVLIGRVYKHFKGDYYIVENIALHTETSEKMVIYRALYGNGELYTRPYSMFTEETNKCGQKYRFELQDINSVVKK